MVLTRQEKRPYTAEDLAKLPADGNRYEIIGGELIVSPAPGEPHQRILSELFGLFRDQIRKRKLGMVYSAPFSVHLEKHDVLEPDLVVMLQGHRSRISDGGIHGPPDIVAEVVSPSSAGNDRVRKFAAYSSSGVREYWIVDPSDESILVYALRGEDYEATASDDGLARSEIVPDLVIDPKDVFQGIDWLK